MAGDIEIPNTQRGATFMRQRDAHREGRVVVVFGPTGTAGSGAVDACLSAPSVAEVRAVTRRPLEYDHPKLIEVMCTDFEHLGPIAKHLHGVDICLFCLGISATKVSDETRYRKIHVGYALAAASTLLAHSPDASFVYLSGSGVNRESRMMWARVKAEAEDKLLALPLTRCVFARPGSIVPMSPTGANRWLIQPLVNAFGLGIGARDLGLAMLHAATDSSIASGSVLTNQDLRGQPKA